MTIIVRQKGSAVGADFEITAGEPLTKGSPLYINANNKAVQYTGATDSSKPKFYLDKSEIVSLPSNVNKINSVAHDGLYTAVVFSTSDAKVGCMLGKRSLSGKHVWGAPIVNGMGSTDFIVDTLFVPQHKCIYVLFIKSSTLYAKAYNLNYEALTVIKHGDYNLNVGRSDSSHKLIYHEEQDRVVAFANANDNVMKAIILNSKSPSVASTTDIYTSSAGNYNVKAAYNPVEKNIIVTWDDRANNRNSYLIVGVFDTTVTVPKSVTNLFPASPNHNVIYNEKRDRLLFIRNNAELYVGDISGGSLTLGSVYNLPSTSGIKGQVIYYDSHNGCNNLLRYTSNSTSLLAIDIDPSSNTPSLLGESAAVDKPGDISFSSGFEAYSFYSLQGVSLAIDYAVSQAPSEPISTFIGLAPDDVPQDVKFKLIPAKGGVYSTPTKPVLTPTEDYRIGFDGTIKAISQTKFLDTLLDVIGYAIQSDELIVNRWR